MSTQSKVLLIYTGGTIGMMKDYQTGALRAFEFEHIHKRIPELSHLDCLIESISFENPIDSSDMNPEQWVRIAEIIEENYSKFDGFVVLHGSDTMSYSASALSFMLEGLTKPVIFTGSQLPIGDLRTDAKENLITSIQLAALKEKGQSVIQEVGLYFEYKLYRGNRTTKINSEHFEAFVSLNYPTLAESGVHLKVHKDRRWVSKNTPLEVHKSLESQVVIIKLFPGISHQVVEGILKLPCVKAVLLETYGSGNASTHPDFIRILKEAIERGVFIANVTQCAGGGVLPGKYDAGKRMDEIGVLNGKDMTTEASITKLMFLLGRNLSHKSLKIKFQDNLRGELS